MNLTHEIKSYVINELKADFVGVCSADVLSEEPDGHRATDFLPNAKSIIIFGKRITDGAIQAAFRTREDNNYDAESVYASYGSDLLPSFHLFFSQFDLANYIERTFGKTAAGVPCNPLQVVTHKNLPKPIFHGGVEDAFIIDKKKVAVAAGLGEIGWSNYILTPEYGPRQEFAMVITALDLEYDNPYNGPKLCDPEKCGICVRMCPTSALSDNEKESETFTVAGVKQVFAKQNANSCIVASSGFRKEFTGKANVPDQIMTNNPSDEELEKAYKEKPFVQWSMNHYPIHYCNKCLLYCPVGNWKERYYDKGLSRFNPEEVIK